VLAVHTFTWFGTRPRKRQELTKITYMKRKPLSELSVTCSRNRNTSPNRIHQEDVSLKIGLHTRPNM